MKENISTKIFIRIDGEYQLWDDLSDELKNKVGTVLNDRALRAVGYKPVEDKETDKNGLLQ